tara:strand:- start:311 stop:817 length:507 start_codon:yes stop_codon:yes gene_type:complete
MSDIDLIDQAGENVFEGDWNETSLDLLAYWIDKCDTMQELHMQAAKRKKCLSRSLAIPSLITAAGATGLSFFLTSNNECDPHKEQFSIPQICASVLTAVTTILTGVSNILKLDMKVSNHRHTAARFQELKKNAKIQLNLPLSRKGDVEVIVSTVSHTFTSIEENAPLV